ncbi:putative secreted protein (Por secretion system target) [Kordia periserrulae]|uniref:Putative secreted protein (Por secretion system target) n=1 Tax=Kordia periserrulae TaxID=701523 RepID=A0A2T6C5Z4_9FLAO|nr:tail fiber domain-containing protein [Kordia periserrulae]PTX63734.1 putative secreted protein (Por secretion system target) [Kordia periserrulae]
MKKTIFLLALFFAGMTFAQNQSAGPVQSTITTPIPQQFGGTEIFRFSKGLVTQLDLGGAFDFNTSRWFSFGRLNTGTQTVYGLRFQLPKKAITLGFQDINDDDPRIQWIGTNKNNLEFRTSDSFTSTSSILNATMTYDGRTFFGKPLASNEPLVGIDYSTVPGNTKTGLIVRNNTDNGTVFTGIKTINEQKGQFKTGISVLQTGKSQSVTGINVTVKEESGDSRGVRVETIGSQTGPTYGVEAAIGSIVANPTGFGAAIYGSSASLPNRFAGYFNGDVFVTGTFTVSDKRLKENIQAEENMLDKLSQLETVSYTFKQNEHLNLPSQLQHGFLAQNLEEVFPELVTTINKPTFDKENKQTGSFEYKAVNYTGLISVLTSSLNEMNNKVTVLETEIADLRNELATTKNKLEGNNDTEVGFTMDQNRPNPFTNQTTINYTLPSDAKATISVFDMSGKFIRDYNLTSQKGQVIISSNEIGKGMFIYSLVSNGEIMVTKKMIVK